MSIDTIGYRAGDDLYHATADIDSEPALQGALAHRKPLFVGFTSVAVATVTVALFIALALAISLSRPSTPAIPADTPDSQRVGGDIKGPVAVSVAVPEGWNVVRSAATVELTRSDGTGASMKILFPSRAYEPPRYQAAKWTEDPVVWTLAHPDLSVSERFGVDGPAYAWTATSMRLSIARSRSSPSQIPLVETPGSGDPTSLDITTADRSFRVSYLYFKDYPPLLVAARSGDADDAALLVAFNQVVRSTKFKDGQ